MQEAAQQPIHIKRSPSIADSSTLALKELMIAVGSPSCTVGYRQPPRSRPDPIYPLPGSTFPLAAWAERV
jgi:hypothetical protein